MIPKKVDWSHVKPKTVSRLSEDVRAQRNSGHHRNRQKPNVVNWKKRATSRVDCKWSSDKYRPSNVPSERLETQRRDKRPKSRESVQSRSRAKRQNQFADSYSHHIDTRSNESVEDRAMNSNNNTEKKMKNRKNRTDDEYLFYLKKDNRVGKIPRDAATAQLQDGSGDMIICPQSSRSLSRSNRSVDAENTSSSNFEISSGNTGTETDYERYVHDESSNEIQAENQLRELQQTFAAIEKAMKQRRRQRRS